MVNQVLAIPPPFPPRVSGKDVLLGVGSLSLCTVLVLVPTPQTVLVAIAAHPVDACEGEYSREQNNGGTWIQLRSNQDDEGREENGLKYRYYQSLRELRGITSSNTNLSVGHSGIIKNSYATSV